jgi:serpin B
MSFSTMHSMLERLRRIVGTTGGSEAGDGQLLTAYLAGQPQAFDELVVRHGRMVHGVCRRVLGNSHDADDAFQAVFMVLARKAGSLTQHESVASWLYGVACRAARKARESAGRRRRREEVVATMTREEIVDEIVEDPVTAVLDAEVNRLPEKYRQPIVLCYLAGESNEEAARRMRCSVGAVKMRLVRARELLRSRLERHGVAVPAITLGILLERQTPTASAALVESTLKAAHTFAAGSASGVTSAGALAQGVIRDMYYAKLKWVALVVVSLGALGLGVGFSIGGQKQAEPDSAGEPAAVAKKAETAPAPAGAVAEKADRAAVVTGNNRFGFELLNKLSKPDANAFISPYSISAALSMTYAGARNETAAEIARTLHFATDQDAWHPAFASVSADLRPAGKEPAYQLHVVNRLWGQSGAQFNEGFLKTTRESYGAGIQAVDFRGDTEEARKTINRWVEEQTKDKIQELIRKGMVNRETRLVLTNAIYFKSAWEWQFSPRFTQPEDFHSGADTSKVPMMHRSAKFGYADLENAELVSLPYKDDALSMVVLLPKKRDGLAAVEKDLDGARLKEWIEKIKPTQVELSLPKFKLIESYELADALIHLGMRKAFSAKEADFSGISNEPYSIGQVIHKAMVDVDENGTEAAAATAVVFRSGAAPREEKSILVKADHPFLFAIRENRTGTVLFLGRLVKPLAK